MARLFCFLLRERKIAMIYRRKRYDFERSLRKKRADVHFDLDEDCEVGDQLGIKIEDPKFSRVDIQTAKQIIFQKV